MEDCKNGGTCTENDCTCTGTFGGYNCGYDTALVAACTADPSPCLNGGTCYNDGTGDLCACPYGYYGNKCENETIQIKCEGNAVEYNLVFPMDFAGTVNLGDNPECAMTESQDPDLNTKSYSLTVDISGKETGCNMTNIETSSNPETGATEFTAAFQVNYLPGITTFLDELYDLTCAHENVDIKLSQDLANVGVVRENLTVSDFNETYSPVELTVLDKLGNPLTADTQLFVGDIFQLHVYLTDDQAYNDVLLVSCTTNNTLTDTDQKTFRILEKSCPTKLSKRLTKGQEIKMYEKTLKDGTVVQTPGKVVSIEAFKFVDSNNIGVVCTAKVCKPDDNSCAVPTNCDEVMNQPTDDGEATEPAPAAGTTPAAETTPAAGTTVPTEPTTGVSPVKRKRRAAKNDAEEEEIVSTILTVLEPREYTKSKLAATEEVNQIEKCLAQGEITALVAVLSTTVCALLVSCFVLVCFALRRRGKANSFKPMPNPRPEKFQIPRAHINDSFNFGEI